MYCQDAGCGHAAGGRIEEFSIIDHGEGAIAAALMWPLNLQQDMRCHSRPVQEHLSVEFAEEGPYPDDMSESPWGEVSE